MLYQFKNENNEIVYVNVKLITHIKQYEEAHTLIQIFFGSNWIIVKDINGIQNIRYCINNLLKP